MKPRERILEFPTPNTRNTAPTRAHDGACLIFANPSKLVDDTEMLIPLVNFADDTTGAGQTFVIPLNKADNHETPPNVWGSAFF